MIFRQFFSDDEVLLYSVAASAITAVHDEDSFNEYVAEIEQMVKDQPAIATARVIVLGLLMGAFLVKRDVEEHKQAKSN